MSPSDNYLYEFDPFVMDVRNGILLNGGVTVRLTPRAFQTLLVLVQHATEVVDKDQLMKKVWPDTFVEEGNLSRNIYELRKALGDDTAEPRFIETIPKRGYRFVAPMKISLKAAPIASPVLDTTTTVIEKHTFARVISETEEATDLPVQRLPVVEVTRLPQPTAVGGKRKINRFVFVLLGVLLASAIGVFLFLRRVHVSTQPITRAKSTLVRLTNN